MPNNKIYISDVFVELGKVTLFLRRPDGIIFKFVDTETLSNDDAQARAKAIRNSL